MVLAAAWLCLAWRFQLSRFLGLSLVSLGGAFFVGVGGYLAALLNTKLGLSPLFSIPLATICGGLICTLAILPCLPLRGVYFSIVTLMYPLLASRLIEALDIFGGTEGIMGVASFPNRWVEQYSLIGLVLVALFGLRRLVNTDLGLVFRAVKDNDQAVKASGMNITHYKTLAVFISSSDICFGR